jgi:glycosyltransferase involved in cell wall biosynthesis
MIRISVVIITYNEEKNIERCLQSVKNIADEILVVDSLSIDGTINIAKNFGAKIISQAFLGHVQQKNFAALQATYDWVLSLDADEALSPGLEKSILQIKEQQAGGYYAYRMCRLTNYCGKWIKHSGWYPDKKVRLFNRTKGCWNGENPHDRWELYENIKNIKDLHGDILHYSFYSMLDHIRKIEQYSDIAARARVEKNKNYSLLKIIVVPGWVFFMNYIVRLGFLDGYYGLIVCKLQAYDTWIKYNLVRQYAAMKKEGKSF